MTKILEMVFENAAGQEVSLMVADPKDNLTAAAVQAVMDLIVAKNIFRSRGGDLVRAVAAHVNIRDTAELA